MQLRRCELAVRVQSVEEPAVQILWQQLVGVDDQRVQAVGLHGSRQQLRIVGLHRSRQQYLASVATMGKEDKVAQSPRSFDRGLGVSPSKSKGHDRRRRLESARASCTTWTGGMELLSRQDGREPRVGSVLVEFCRGRPAQSPGKARPGSQTSAQNQSEGAVQTSCAGSFFQEIQDLLEEPPAPKPTGRQAVEAANKQFKEATFKLREAIIQKSDLQGKVDKVKDQYMASEAAPGSQ